MKRGLGGLLAAISVIVIMTQVRAQDQAAAGGTAFTPTESRVLLNKCKARFQGEAEAGDLNLLASVFGPHDPAALYCDGLFYAALNGDLLRADFGGDDPGVTGLRLMIKAKHALDPPRRLAFDPAEWPAEKRAPYDACLQRRADSSVQETLLLMAILNVAAADVPALVCAAELAGIERGSLETSAVDAIAKGDQAGLGAYLDVLIPLAGELSKPSASASEAELFVPDITK